MVLTRFLNCVAEEEYKMFVLTQRVFPNTSVLPTKVAKPIKPYEAVKKKPLSEV